MDDREESEKARSKEIYTRKEDKRHNLIKAYSPKTFSCSPIRPLSSTINRSFTFNERQLLLVVSFVDETTRYIV